MYEQIYLGFVQLVEKGEYSKTQAAHILAQRHGLSARRIRAIVKTFIDEHGEEYAAELKALSACDGTESAREESVQANDGASLHQ